MNETLMNILEKIILWSSEHALSILLIILVTWLVLRFMIVVISRLIKKLVPRGSFVSDEEEKKREDTLIKITQNFLSIFVWIVALFAVLSEFGVPIAPLITGAGILGVAIGFGSQSLVKDVITGLFIIAENQFRIGDVVSIGSHTGTVEGMTLRVTKLRQLDGTIHYIPNGEIKVASNKSKDYSMVDLKIDVGYNTKIDHLENVVNEVGESLANDPDFGKYIIDSPKFLRIDDFSDYAIKARILGKVFPKKQYLVAGELRKRLKNVFEEKDIDIPYPTRVVYNVEQKKDGK